jgi:hypothetical protein
MLTEAEKELLEVDQKILGLYENMRQSLFPEVPSEIFLAFESFLSAITSGFLIKDSIHEKSANDLGLEMRCLLLNWCKYAARNNLDILPFFQKEQREIKRIAMLQEIANLAERKKDIIYCSLEQ